MARQLLNTVNTANPAANEHTCFVCGNLVAGRFYHLATCRTQETRSRVIEKLGQLVGDDHVVVISEDDIICRGCAVRVNTLDKCEKEYDSLRSVLLKCLERKNKLNEGELVNSKGGLANKRKSEIMDFHTRKQKSVLGIVDGDDLKDTKETTWRKCDTCHFTVGLKKRPPAVTSTVSSSKPQSKVGILNNIQQPRPKTTMLRQITQQNHLAVSQTTPVQQRVVDHTQKETTEELLQTLDNQVITSEQIVSAGSSQQINEQNIPNKRQKIDENQVVNQSVDTSTVLPGLQVKKELEETSENSSQPEIASVDVSQDFVIDETPVNEQALHLSVQGPDGGGKNVTFQNVVNEDGTESLCMVDENGVVLQKVEQAEDGTWYFSVPGTDSNKHMLSVAEDGSVQMVEVFWDGVSEGSEQTAAAQTFVG